MAETCPALVAGTSAPLPIGTVVMLTPARSAAHKANMSVTPPLEEMPTFLPSRSFIDVMPDLLSARMYQPAGRSESAATILDFAPLLMASAAPAPK